MRRLISNIRYVDFYALACVLFLLAIGCVAIYSLAAIRDQISLFYQHLFLVFLGLGAMTALAGFDYRKLQGFAPLLYAIGIIFLIAILIYGDTRFGATRWIDFGFFQFQPSELVKIFLILLLARILSGTFQKMTWMQFAFALILIIVPVVLVISQPDLGTAISIVFIAFIMLLSSKLPKEFWLLLVSLGVIASLILSARLEGYQLSRLQTFLNPTADPQGEGYNVIQSMIAVGNGGFYGQGIGQGTQSQLSFLPVAHSDFIFAGIAEISGFLGSAFVVLLFTLLIVRALVAANRSADSFGYFIAIGIAAFWSLQFIVNVGMVLGLAPITGIPLPFVSYGGTSMVVSLATFGILQSIIVNGKKRMLSI